MLDVDFGALGLDPDKTVLLTPAVAGVQTGQAARPWNASITMPADGGLIGVLTENADFLA